jgi:hypothetical protein
MGEKTFYARWKPPASITITLRAASEPSLEAAIVSKHDQITFTIESGPGMIAVDWYWDGDLAVKAGGSSYTLAAGSQAAGRVRTVGEGERRGRTNPFGAMPGHD